MIKLIYRINAQQDDFVQIGSCTWRGKKKGANTEIKTDKNK